MANKNITIEVASSRESYEQDGPELVYEVDSMKDAKKRAKYYLSTEYQRVIEASEPFGFAAVLVDGVCEVDFES